MINDYIRLVRPKHALKNVYVLLPLVFSRELTNVPLLWKTFLAFLTFCCTASIVYVMNDLKDAEKDRLHPEKKKRPIASGAVSCKGAIGTICVLAAIILILGLLCGFPWMGWMCILCYLLLNIVYSFGLKTIPIVDVTILTFGFLLRMLFGSSVIGIAVSNWLYLTVMAISFYMALGKRRNELRQNSTETRDVLRLYSYSFLDKNMQICLTLGITFYALWSMQVPTALGVGPMVWTVPLVLCICMKYSLAVEGDSDGDPVEVIYSDKILLTLIVIFSAVILALLYF